MLHRGVADSRALLPRFAPPYAHGEFTTGVLFRVDMLCPRCGTTMEKGFLRDRAWMSGDGPRTIFLRDSQGANIVAWRCMGCGKVELEIER